MEFNFDGLVGPTHNYGGLSFGNVASTSHGGQASNPRAAALQGLTKMRFVRDLGVGQAVLPPQPRPNVRALRQLGFAGSDQEVLASAADHLLRLTSSASSMWTANAATVAPSADTADRKLHLTPANLTSMFHRALEAETTTRVLRAIFPNAVVHDPLPGGEHFADEGAANHTRLVTDGHAAVHLFAYGRSTYRPSGAQTKFPARQTLEASEAIARLHGVARPIFARQHPDGIDAGAFHTDVLAVGTGGFLMLHELAFSDAPALLAQLKQLLGDGFRSITASEKELPVAACVKAYPFNSQLVTLPDGALAIIAPIDSQENEHARRFLERVVSEGHVKAVHYLDVRQSMHNGGGPACLRQRIVLTDAERTDVKANVFFDAALDRALTTWVEKHYRDRLVADDLRDPKLLDECRRALDELTQILRLGSVYDFQLTSS